MNNMLSRLLSLANLNKLFVILIILLIFSPGCLQSMDLVDSNENMGGGIGVTDSLGVYHYFEESPSRIAITNTYAASVMRMLNVNSSVIVGVSGDFYDEALQQAGEHAGYMLIIAITQFMLGNKGLA